MDKFKECYTLKEFPIDSMNYFTPDIEDIRIGYECEALLCCAEPREWIPLNITKDDTETYGALPLEEVLRRLKDGEIRVPYLSKEQIQAEGWEQAMPERAPSLYIKGNWYLNLNYHKFYGKEHYIQISDSNKFDYSSTGRSAGVHFEGECKDINTFRTICKLLKI